MSDMLTKIMALLQGNGGWVSDVQRSGVRPDFGLTGAQVLAPQKSPYERTLRPGEQRSSDELRDMLAEVILAAGAAVVPGVGPKGQARQAPARIRKGSEREFAEFFGGSKLVDKEGKPLTLYHGTSAEFSKFRPQAGANAGAIGDWPGIYLTPDPKAASGIAQFEGRLRGGAPNVMPVHARATNPAEFGQYRTIAEAIRAGHDSRVVRDMNGNITEVLVFTPEQIKSAIGNRGTYSRTNPDIRE